MLEQEDDPDLDDECLTADDWLTLFRKDIEQIVGRVKGSEPPSVHGTQSYKEDLVVRDKFPIRTERQSFI